MEQIEITTESITLEGLLKFSGLAETGGMAKLMIHDGLGSVNGSICTQRGKKLRNGDRVSLQKREIEVVYADQLP
jgi:ribosome-associated protein